MSWYPEVEETIMPESKWLVHPEAEMVTAFRTRFRGLQEFVLSVVDSRTLSRTMRS